MAAYESTDLVSLAGLIALLDLIERAAAAVTAQGHLLGANARWTSLAGQDAEAGPEAAESPPLEAIFDSPSAALLRASLEHVPGTAARHDAVLANGDAALVRVEPLPGSPFASAAIIVLDMPFRAARREADPVAEARAELRHDLAGPLTATLGVAELLLTRPDELGEETRRSLEQIVDNCARMIEALAASRQGDRRSREAGAE